MTVSVAAAVVADGQPSLLVKTARYCLLLSVNDAVNDNVALFAPEISLNDCPSADDCH